MKLSASLDTPSPLRLSAEALSLVASPARGEAEPLAPVVFNWQLVNLLRMPDTLPKIIQKINRRDEPDELRAVHHDCYHALCKDLE